MAAVLMIPPGEAFVTLIAEPLQIFGMQHAMPGKRRVRLVGFVRRAAHSNEIEVEPHS